jgi:hypothetical protein
VARERRARPLDRACIVNAVHALEQLKDRIDRERMRLSGQAEFRERTAREHAAFLAESTERESRIEAELAELFSRLPAAQAAADEELRLADLAAAQAELDELLEADRREQERLKRVAELRDRLGHLTEGASQ